MEPLFFLAVNFGDFSTMPAKLISAVKVDRLTELKIAMPFFQAKPCWHSFPCCVFRAWCLLTDCLLIRLVVHKEILLSLLGI